jgi:putative ABC transport system permease protein
MAGSGAGARLAGGGVMRVWSEVRERLRSLAGRAEEERELEEELRFHLELDVEERVRAGATPAEARRAARAAFGPSRRAAEAVRDARGVGAVEDLGRDLRYGLRSLRRAPGFSVVVVLALGLGIGAATAMYSLVHGILLRPLPYPAAEHLYTVFEAGGQGAIRQLSYPDFADWRDGAAGVMGLTFARGDDVTVQGEDGAQRLISAYVTAEFFQVLGTTPLLGRTFGPPEVAEGDVQVAVVSHDLWQRRFGGSADVVGQTLPTTDASYRVVGVMPPEFAMPQWADLWLPLEALPPAGRYALERRDLHVDSQVLGRLAPGVTEEQATAALQAVAARVAETHRGEAYEWGGAALVSLPETVVGDARTPLLLLAGAVALLLLAACVNVANLYLARATARAREFGVRTALGADRGRLVRQLLTESALLSGAGGVLGVVLAVLGLRAVRAGAPEVLPRLAEVSLDARVLMVSLALVAGTTFLVGLAPALGSAGRRTVGPLRAGGERGGASRRTVRVRSALVVAQVAIALVLVVGSGLLLRSLWQVQEVDLGFDADRVVVVRVFPPSPRYDDERAAAELYRRLREAAAAVPGVEHAALANHMPVAGGWMPTRVVAGAEPPASGQELALFRTVSPEYFAVVRSELLAGRLLDEADMAGAGGGVVVNQSLASNFWPGEDPLGRSITVFAAAQGREGFGEPITAQVVGVVADERFFGPEADAPSAVYLPYTWTVWANIFVAARTTTDPERLIPSLQRALAAVDPDLPIAGPGRQAQLRPLEAYLDEGVLSRRVSALLLTSFGAAAFLLAALGIFGVMAYVVTLRRQELGVRLALGAPGRRIGWMVTRDALRLTLLGLLAGLVASAFATRFLQAQLFEIDAVDVATYVTAIALFTAVGALAALLPALRAARTDPLVALRAEP